MSACHRLVCIVLLATFMATPILADTVAPRHDGHKLLRTYPDTWAQVEQMRSLAAVVLSDGEQLGRMDYVVPPEALAQVDALGLAYEVILEDVQKSIDAERERLVDVARIGPRDAAWFQDYKTFDQIVAKLNAMVADRPDLCTLIDIGNSIEGRDLWCLRISGPGTDKPAVLFDAGQHAREWIGPAVTMWIADKFVYEYDTNPTIHSLVDRVEFFIVPVVNPDGYVYTWNTYRLWRKNRHVNGGGCYGVDLNRNWDADWGGASTSSDPCNDLYCGTGPFSEPETIALSNFLIAHPQIVTLMDYHSYSQLILSPYGYTFSLPADNATFLALDEAMHDEILAVHGVQYDYGPVASTIYQCSGGSVDWGYDELGLWSFSIELRDTGTYGFELPPAQIIPTCEENFPAALYLAEWSSTPLRISFPDGLPLLLGPGVAQALTVQVSAIGATVDTASPRLFTRIGTSGAFTESTLTALGGDEYQATLPATPCGKTLYYYVSAATTGGATTYSPADAPTSTYSVEAYPTVALVDETFETANAGWVVGATDDDATVGMWDRMDPQATAAQPEDDHTTTGTQCWVTNGTAGSGVGTYDVDGGKTTLSSPEFDGSAASTVVVSYWRWYSNNQGSAPNADVFTVDITGNGGANWTNVETVGPSGAEAGGGWYYHEFVVSDVVAVPTATMKLRFVAADEGSGSIVEAALDDFRITVVQDCPYLPGDMNCDGEIGFADINPFVTALVDPTNYPVLYPSCDIMNADINDDGAVSFADINPFVDLLVD